MIYRSNNHSSLDLELISVKDYCANHTHLKRVTVYKMISRGKLPIKKIGGKIYIYKNHLPDLDE
jgi:predicted DNA-binding transcriptional regulator AlpA